MRTALIAGSAFAALLVASPVAEAAKKKAPKSAALKGQVVSTPYSGRRLTAVPVLLSKTAAKKAGLQSPVGVLILPQSRAVSSGEGALLPAKLRVGDQFTARIGRGAIGSSVRKSPYWRIPVSSLAVTVRAAVLSTTELQELVAQLRRDLDALSTYAVGLVGSTTAQFVDVRSLISGLRVDLNALRAQLDGLVSQLAGLSNALSALDAALRARIDALDAQLQALLGQVTSLESAVATLQSTVAGLVTSLGVLSNGMTTLTSQVSSLMSTVTNIAGRLTIVEDVLDGILPGQLGGALTSLTSLTSQVGGITSQLTTVDGRLDGLDSDLAGATASLTSLQTDVGTLTGHVTDIQGDLGDAQTDIAGLTGSVGTLQSGLSSVTSQVSTLDSTVSGLQSSLTTLGNQVNGPGGLAADVAGLCGLTVLGVPLGTACS